MNWVEVISAVMGLTCVLLAGRNSKYNFWVGYVYNTFLLVLCWKTNLYSSMILCIISFAINTYGHWKWTHPSTEERSRLDSKKLKVSKLDKKVLALCIAVSCALAVLWALFLKDHTDDVSPWLGSFIMMATFLAQYMSARKVWQCWIVWLVVNVANIVLYLSAERYIMASTYGLYFINGVWGMVSWLKLYKNEQHTS